MAALVSRSFVALTFVLLLAPLLVPEPAEAQSEAEDETRVTGWAPGDYWVWKKDPTSARGSRSEGNLTWKVGGYQTTEMEFWETGDPVSWRQHDTIRVNTWLNTTIPTEEANIYIRQETHADHRVSDMAIARSYVSDRYIIPIDNETEEGGTVRDMQRFAPEIVLQSPFAVGDAWRVRTERRYLNLESEECGGDGQPSCRGEGKAVYTYQVVGTETLDLEVNGRDQSFDTWRIKVTDESTGSGNNDQTYEVWWYAPEVCNYVLREQYGAQRQKLGIFTLREYSCQGTPLDDPDYSEYSFTDFSSTRFHGELNSAVLREVRPEFNQPEPRFFWAPGPGAALFLLALAGLGLAARRRGL